MWPSNCYHQIELRRSPKGKPTMSTLTQAVSDVETLLALQPEELGRILLGVAAAQLQNGMFHPNSVTSDANLYGAHSFDAGRHYPQNRKAEISIAIGEAWHWLELNMLIMPATDTNGQNGFMRTAVQN